MAEFAGTATLQDVADVRRDVAELRAAVRQLKAQVDGLGPQLDARLREKGPQAEGQSNPATGRLEGLSTSVSHLTTRVDELVARVDNLSNLGLQTRQAPSPAPSEPARSSPVASGRAPSAARPPAPAAVPSPGAAPVAPAPLPGTRPTTGSLQPQDLYQAAYIDFSKGSYPLAIAGFREFIRRYPDHDLADNAQYWVGEAHLAQARGYADAGKADQAEQSLQQAVQEFRRVVANYPRGDKTPTALYKEALALVELKQPQLAQQRLQYLVDNFPQAEETPLARERLAALKER